jgi:hypothetical protein
MTRPELEQKVIEAAEEWVAYEGSLAAVFKDSYAEDVAAHKEAFLAALRELTKRVPG